MRLLVISHTEHWRQSNGTVAGWAATVREIDRLSEIFEEIVHVAPLYPGEAPKSAVPYEEPAVRLRGIKPAGGPRLRDKARILLNWPRWGLTMLAEARRADVLHIRCPAAVSLIAVVLLFFTRKPKVRWVKFAGNWQGHALEPLATRLQRHLLRIRGHGAQVTVNSAPENAPLSGGISHVHPFLNPCFAAAELGRGVSERPEPFRILFVGRLYSVKRVDDILRAYALLESTWDRGTRRPT